MQLDFYPYGSQFFRPPNPPRKDWKKNLKQLVDNNFNIVKYWPMWTWMHNGPGLFDFSEIDELMDLAESMKLRVVLNTNIESSPYWLEEKYPESRYQTADGFAFALQPRSNTAVGGWPGLCLDHPEVRAQAGEFLEQVAKRYVDHPALYAYDVWNEPHLEPAAVAFSAPEERNLYCYCDSTITDFRRWLKKRYGSLEGLCDAWVHKYTSWEQVNPPRRREVYQDMMDWRIYMTENLAEQLKWRIKTIRKHDKKHILMTHVWGPMSLNSIANASIDPWKLSEPVQMFGTSIFPRWWWKEYDLVRFAFHLDGTIAAGKGKPYWISELQGGCGMGLFDGIRRPPTPTAHEMWIWNWLGIAHGMNGLMYWQWRSERLGTEAPGFGLLNIAGEPTERSEMAKEVAAIIKKNEKLFVGAKPVKKEVAIVQDPYSQTFNFAAEGDSGFYAESCIGYYRALWEANIPINFLHSELEIDKGKFDRTKVLVLPLPQAMKEETAKQIKEFVKKGGILWCDAAPAHYDQLGRCSEIIPGWGLTELFGAREKEVYIKEDKLNIEAGACKELGWEREREVQGFLYAENLVPSDGEPVGWYQGKPCITWKRYGKGIAILNGTYFGLSLCRDFHQPTADLLLDVLRAAGVKPPMELSAPQINAYLLEGKGYRIALLFNMTDQTRKTTVKVRGFRPKKAKDLISETTLTVKSGTVTTTLEPMSVQAIHLA